MKYKILLFLTVVTLCFVFSLTCFAYDLDGSFVDFQGDAVGSTELCTPTEMLSYISDYSVAFQVDNVNVVNVIFYISSYSNLHNKIIEYYDITFGSISFTDYINFNIDYQSLSILTQGNTHSNFNVFSSYLNSIADSYSTNQGVIQEIQRLSTAFNQLSNEYSSLLSDFNNLQSQYQIVLSDFTELENRYNALVIEKNNLQNQYNSLLNDYNILLNSYQNRLDEILVLEDEILILQGEIDYLDNLILHMENEYEDLLKQAEANYQIGFSDGMSEGDTMTNGLVSIFGAPMYVFGEVFDFEIFGLNILSLIKFILTISIVGYVILKLRS